jgi:hypothetical protein
MIDGFAPTPTEEERHRMIVRYKESACYIDDEFSHDAIELLKHGLVAFYPPNRFAITEFGHQTGGDDA